MREWKVNPYRKNSIYMQVNPAITYWTWNKKWLDNFLNKKYITNLEYLEGIEMLNSVKKETASNSTI
jgi:hypothetical protein